MPSNGDEGRGSVLSLLDAEALGCGSSITVGQRAPVRQVNLVWLARLVSTYRATLTLDHELAPHLLRWKETSHLQCGTIRSSFLILRRRQKHINPETGGRCRTLFSSSLASRFLLLTCAGAPSTGGTRQRKPSYVPESRPAPSVRTP